MRFRNITPYAKRTNILSSVAFLAILIFRLGSFAGESKENRCERQLQQTIDRIQENEYIPKARSLSPVGQVLRRVLAETRRKYRDSPTGLNVKHIFEVNDGDCGKNVTRLLEFATTVKGFDVSRARVLRIDTNTDKMAPYLFANRVSRPRGYNADLADLYKVLRNKADMAVSWNFHYVLEYEGRIYDLDFAEDEIPTTLEYIETMFSDVLTGNIDDSLRSRYAVKVTAGSIYLEQDEIHRASSDWRTPNRFYFFDFYRSLPGAKVNLTHPPMHFTLGKPVGYYSSAAVYWVVGNDGNPWRWEVLLMDSNIPLTWDRGGWRDGDGRRWNFALGKFVDD